MRYILIFLNKAKYQVFPLLVNIKYTTINLIIMYQQYN